MSKGALGAALTGSGSAVFAVFENIDAAENAVKNMELPFKIIANPI